MNSIREITRQMNTIEALYQSLIVEEDFNWFLSDLTGDMDDMIYAGWFSSQMSGLLDDYMALEIELQFAVGVREYAAAQMYWVA